eukprot:COSAG03_NODE_5019_length_1362_cov_0.984956_1_plen_112_part_10
MNTNWGGSPVEFCALCSAFPVQSWQRQREGKRATGGWGDKRARALGEPQLICGATSGAGMSDDAEAACPKDEPSRPRSQGHGGAWNGMIHPILNHTITGAIWSAPPPPPPPP